jgi:hypothetical protein
MKTAAYTALAPHYRELMRNIDYSSWAAYIAEMVHSHIDHNAQVVELAAGVGDFAESFRRFHPSIIVTDLSLDMLSFCNKDHLGRVACDMRALPFRQNSVAAFICLFDSINYITSQKQMLLFFRNIFGTLQSGGIFVFDSCLIAGSIKHASRSPLTHKSDGCHYRQISTFNPKNSLHTNVFTLTLQNGEVNEEVHYQKIYTLSTLLTLVFRAGFTVLKCKKNFTNDDCDESADRVQFLVRK